MPARTDSENYNLPMLLAVLTISDRCSQGLQIDTAAPPSLRCSSSFGRKPKSGPASCPTTKTQLPASLKSSAPRTPPWSSPSAAPASARATAPPRQRVGSSTAKRPDSLKPCASMAPSAIHSHGSRAELPAFRDTTLIVNLPGSKRGAEESLASIAACSAMRFEVAGGGQTHP